MASLETLALTLVIPLLGFGVGAADPFYLSTQFPWLILAPLLASLRYGFLFGITSASSLIMVFALGLYCNWSATPFFPVETVVGMLLLTLMTGEFHNIWQQKIQGLQQKNHYLNQRMNEFSRTYHLLKGSHSQLEQQLANYSKSMRTSLLDLDRLTQALAKHDGDPIKGISEQILKLFSDYGSIQTASLYNVSDGHKLSIHPISCLGNPPAFWPSNPLIREALRTGSVTSIQHIDGEISQEIIVAIPLIDVYQKIWGVVIVNEMPLFALQENTLDLLSLLGGYIGDLIYRRMETNLFSRGEWANLEHELRRVIRDAQSFKVDTGVVVSIVNNANTYDKMMVKFHSELRGIDKIMNFRNDYGQQIIINLLPMTDENGLKDFLSRLDLVQSVDTLNPVDTNMLVHAWILNDKQSLEKTLAKITQLCRHQEIIPKIGEYTRAEISA
jgi:hypothetical protein